MNKIKSIHFVGIKGVGMTPLAVIAKEAGFVVTGSDVADVYITDEILQKADIQVTVGFYTEHLKHVDLVITTGAHGGYSNPEVIAAKKQGIPIMTQGEAVGFFMSGEPYGRKDMEGISIAGCHGKTTTTAMIATLLHSAGKDPSYVIGTGFVPSLGSSGHYGKGRYFVAEADEYATEPQYDKTPKLLWQHPRIAVVTNIEYDHPDLYPTFASLVAVYKDFIFRILEKDGVAIVCGDDPEIQNIIRSAKGKIITYGFDPHNDYIISRVDDVVGGTQFCIVHQGKRFGEFMTPLFGVHNALNATASILVAHEIGLDKQIIQKGVLGFLGTKRRTEYIGRTSTGAAIFDDYAHHPTEIQKTLFALRGRYVNKKIVCIFQPHTFSRTKLLFEEFNGSFTSVDMVILTDIYASQREKFDSTISSKDMAEKIGKRQDAIYLPHLDNVVQYIREKQYGPDIIIVTMGAGDVYKIGYQLLK